MTSPPQRTYRQLLNDVCALYESTLQLSLTEQRRQRVRAYWEIGERINAAQRASKAAPERRFMERLSNDMMEKFGNGFGARLLYDIRKFAGQYRAADLNGQLTWNQYRALLAIGDDAARRRIEQATVERQLSPAAIRKWQKNGNDGALDWRPLLQPRKASLGIYKVVKEPFDKKWGYLDLGFNAQQAVPLESLQPFNGGAFVRQGKDGLLEEVHCTRGERYCFEGRMVEAVDGDTLLMRLDLGFERKQIARIRLRGVAAPERDCESGVVAWDVLKRFLPAGCPVRVFTYDVDKYGRWIGDVLYGGKYRTAHNLNHQMIESGAAAFLDNI